MKYLNKINRFRRNVTKLITYNIGNSKAAENPQTIDKILIKRILISRPNHRLGNLLLITPIVQEVTKLFPDSKIDLFVKGNAAHSIFQNYDNIDQIIGLPKEHFKYFHRYAFSWLNLKKHKYDIIINTVGFSSSGKLSTQFAKGTFKYFGTEFTQGNLNAHPEELKHSAKQTIYGFRNFLSDRGISNFQNEIPALNIKLNHNELSEGKRLVYKLVKNRNKTICLFTYATGSKCYSEQWWNDFYDIIKLNFPNYNIIEVLPIEKISKINFKAPFFYSRDLREIGSFISNTSLFIGADSGMMHLASASKTTTIGLFSITDPALYAPYGNNSTAVNTNTVSQEECIEIIKKKLDRNM